MLLLIALTLMLWVLGQRFLFRLMVRGRPIGSAVRPPWDLFQLGPRQQLGWGRATERFPSTDAVRQVDRADTAAHIAQSQLISAVLKGAGSIMPTDGRCARLSVGAASLRLWLSAFAPTSDLGSANVGVLLLWSNNGAIM